MKCNYQCQYESAFNIKSFVNNKSTSLAFFLPTKSLSLSHIFIQTDEWIKMKTKLLLEFRKKRSKCSLRWKHFPQVRRMQNKDKKKIKTYVFFPSLLFSSYTYFMIPNAFCNYCLLFLLWDFLIRNWIWILRIKNQHSISFKATALHRECLSSKKYFLKVNE